MGGTIIEFTLTWDQTAILTILYLNKREISKQKLSTLLYLVYKELKNLAPKYIKPLEDLNFYIDIKTKQIITEPNINVILNNLSYIWEAVNFNLKDSMVYLTDEGYKVAKAIINDPEFKDEIDIVMKVVTQYKDLSEEGLMNLILENLKHS
jgi:hypothetical protein